MRTHYPTYKITLIAFLVIALIFSRDIQAFNLESYFVEAASFNKDSLKIKLNVFPYSPNQNHKTVLTFTITNPTRVTIKIFDVEGREVADLFERNIPAGTFELLLETKYLKKGMYYCKFFTGEKISMKKMIMVK